MVVVAHRGSAESAPENTMAAFRKAVEAGADMIELDVRFTRDWLPVVIHDRTLRRTTTGSGQVRRTMCADLHSLDAGSWFHRDFSREHVPTLDEVLNWLPAHTGLNIEVKTDGDPRSKTIRANILAGRLAGWNKTRTLLVSSFDHRFLQRFHRLSPSTPLGVLYMPVRDMRTLPSRLAGRVGAGVFICSRARLRRRWCFDAHAHGIRVAVYGVNTANDLKRVTDRGADMVITDRPELLRGLLRKP
jgi:glycerophosphoryl diester phosphodiesterase